MFCAPGLIFYNTEGVGSFFHVLRSRTRFRRFRGRWFPFSCFALQDSFSAVPSALGPVFMFCVPALVFEGAEGIVSRFHFCHYRNRCRRCRVGRVPFSCFACRHSFFTVPGASVPVFMFCATRLVVGGAECVESRFPVLRSRTRFQRCRVRRVPCSCFSLPDSFSAVPRASVLVFMFCALRLIFGGTEGVRYRFHVLRARIRLLQYRGRQVPFSSFALPDSFSAVPRASVPIFMFTLSDSLSEVPRASDPVFMFCSPILVVGGTEGVGPVFMFCAPILVLGGTEGVSSCFHHCATEIIFGGTVGVRSRFHVLRVRTRFLRYRGRPFPFSCFALPDSLSVLPRASGPVFMFCALALIFDGTEGVGSRFHVLRSQTRYRRCRVLRVPFSCFALPDSFSAVLRASCSVFMFCAPGLVVGDAECVGSRFHVLRARTHFRLYRGCRFSFSCFVLPDSFSAVPSASGPVFMFFAPRLIFDGTDGVSSRFHVLRSRTSFRRYSIPFSCFARPDLIATIPRATGPVFMFCAPGLVFGGSEGVGSRFNVFALHDSFSAVPSALGPVFMFCAPALVFEGAEGVVSRFHVFRYRTRCRRCRVRRVPFLCFARRHSFSTVPRASVLVFMFCATRLVVGGAECVGSRFHVLRA
jgi:hypothetical protein